MQKREIERVKRNFSRFCTSLLRNSNIPNYKKRIILSNQVIKVTNELIKLNANKESYHYINKCYVLTYRKLS